jgi:hypothetical protein
LFGVGETVDGDDGGDGYSPLGKFELERLAGSDDNRLGGDEIGHDDDDTGDGDNRDS